MKQEPLKTPSPAKRVWILDEGSQGHLVQSRGLVRELSKVVTLDVTEVPISCMLPRRISRSLVKRLLHRVSRKWMFRLLHPRMTLPQETPDLMISSGPHSLAALEYLAKQHGCPSVFVQGTIHVPEGAVTAVMRPFEGRHRADFIFIPLLFTEITPRVVEKAKRSYLAEKTIRPQGPVNALFIGYSSAKIRFSWDDWNGIVRFVNDLWKNEGAQWLITTSYRTGSEIDALLKRGIHPDAILDAVWYSEAPRRITKEFLGLADRVFVTMDSLTMLTEAVASGRPTCALCPAALAANSSNTHLHYIRQLAENGFIRMIRPGFDERVQPLPMAPPAVDYSQAINQLLTRLQWNA